MRNVQNYFNISPLPLMLKVLETINTSAFLPDVK